MPPLSSCSRPAGIASRRSLWAFAALLAIAVLTGCASSSDGSGTTAGDDSGDTAGVTSGTIGGLAFTVIDGTIYQDDEDGEIYADDEGGMIAFDEDTEDLGMSDPTQLRLELYYSLTDGGFIRPMAHGVEEDLFENAVWALVSRSGSDFTYGIVFTGESNWSGTFDPAPPDPDGEVSQVFEFYQDGVANYGGTGEGVAFWPFGDMIADFNDDVMGCPVADEEWPVNGTSVGLELDSGTVTSVAAVDNINGPCE